MSNDKKYYSDLLKRQQAEYDLMTAGVVGNASDSFKEALNAEKKLTLEMVCKITDTLNANLGTLARAKDMIDFSTSQLNKIKEVEGDEDGNK